MGVADIKWQIKLAYRELERAMQELECENYYERRTELDPTDSLIRAYWCVVRAYGETKDYNMEKDK